MAKGKTKTIGTILFFIVSFAMGIIVGIVIDSKLFKNNNNNTNNTPIGKVERTDNILSEKLFKIINNNYLEKVIYNYRSNGIVFEDITNDEKLFLSELDKYYKTSGTWVSFNTLKENLINNYGSDYNIKAEDYNYHDIAIIKYNEDNYEYNGSEFKYSDTSTYIDLYNTIKLEKEDNNYYLTVMGIYHQKLKDTDDYTNDKGFIFNEGISTSTTVDDLYKTNSEQFMKYIFVFNNEDNAYILNSFTKVN